MNVTNQLPVTRKFLYAAILFTILFATFGLGNLPPVRAGEVIPGTQSQASLQQAHYIVFEKHPDGTIIPVYYRPVELSGPLTSMSGSQVADALAQPQRSTEFLAVSLQAADGGVVYQNIIQVSPWLRGEFHGEESGDPIDGHILPAGNTSFVVRVPVIEGTTLILKDSRMTTIAQFDLVRLPAETPFITLDPTTAIESGLRTGPAANRVDLLVMGDGYTAAQSAQFNSDVSNAITQFFSISPYAEYKNYFNILTLFTASTQSGADHPLYNASCGYYDPLCCGDPAMLSDPLHGKMVNTAFDARYCAYYIHRLLVVDESKVFAAAAALSDWDVILLVVNDTTYGGSGGEIAVFSTNASAPQIAQHEFGHSFVQLADEYDSVYPGYPTCSDISGPACESNVTDVTNPSLIKWSPWILGTTPIPTPETGAYSGLVGLFEGARYFTTGMYRPGLSCIMQSLGAPYCQVPSQSFVLKLYTGGWGVPATGISLIEPGTNSPASKTVYLTRPATQTFHANSLSPTGGPTSQITWLKNGVVIPGESGNSYIYTTSPSDPHIIKITMRVTDVTSMVNSSMSGGALQDQFTWTVILDAKTLTMQSTAAYDGWILESTENSGAGGTLNTTATTFNLGDETADRQYRSILSFNTATLPNTAVITNVTLKIRKQGQVGTNPFAILGGLKVDIRKPYFGTTVGLVVSDFKATPGKSAVGTFKSTPVSSWYSAVIGSTGFPYINKTGTTQFRLSFAKDDNDDMGADYMSFFSGNYTTVSARPTLIITYYVP